MRRVRGVKGDKSGTLTLMQFEIVCGAPFSKLEKLTFLVQVTLQDVSQAKWGFGSKLQLSLKAEQIFHE